MDQPGWFHGNARTVTHIVGSACPHVKNNKNAALGRTEIDVFYLFVAIVEGNVATEFLGFVVTVYTSVVCEVNSVLTTTIVGYQLSRLRYGREHFFIIVW